MSSVRSAWSASAMRSAKASSPEVSKRIPDRLLPSSSAATMRPSVVVAGFGSAELWDFSTCFGRVAQPASSSTRTARGASEPPPRLDCPPHIGLRIGGSYQAHFACMQTQRHIRSFVLRAGRMTPAQERALTELWPSYGVDLSDGLLDLEAIFGRRAPRCLEIGFGVGEVIGSLAENHPQIDYLGVEVHRPGVGRLLLRAAQANARNLRVICRDAVEVLRDKVPNESFDEILVFFPDPWHKKRHHKRRLIDAEFAALLAAKLRRGGVLRLATDWQGVGRKNHVYGQY